MSFAATLVMAGGVMAVGAGSASAAVPQNVKFYESGMESDGSRNISVYVGQRYAGQIDWVANGDTLKATDLDSDGWGVGAYLSTSPVREATTFGHTARYTATKGGDLPEGHHYKLWACVGGSGGLVCSDQYDVHA
ncbi:hypothetical protein [Streptomyces murinus]|uniref:hypothetical protein n=1 Tax=Streptomyces murinus TaxID=33900 RepID=UPI002E149465|nr:hypothetical protein OG516_37295 [Streptomyces murinus]